MRGTPRAEAPVVSVAMLAFNHERYLDQAIESVLAQRVDFPIEIVVGEDCSTDGTRAVLLQLLDRHPGVVRPILHERNVGMHANTKAVLEGCSGKYVALLEGDDYWTDTEKLALQVAALERDPSLVGCYHLVRSVTPEDRDSPGSYSHPCPHVDGRLRFEDLLWSCGMSTCSVVFRRAAWQGYPDWLRSLPVAEWSIFLLLAQHGDFLYLPRCMADYRFHGAGAWSGISRLRRIETLVACYLTYRTVFGRATAQQLSRGLYYNLSQSVRHMEDVGDPPTETRQALKLALSAAARLGRWPSSRDLWWLFRLQFPSLHGAIHRARLAHRRRRLSRPSSAE